MGSIQDEVEQPKMAKPKPEPGKVTCWLMLIRDALLWGSSLFHLLKVLGTDNHISSNRFPLKPGQNRTETVQQLGVSPFEGPFLWFSRETNRKTVPRRFGPSRAVPGQCLNYTLPEWISQPKVSKLVVYHQPRLDIGPQQINIYIYIYM